MFLIEAKGKAAVWNNSVEDDFIRFLPANLKCEPSDLSIHHIPDDLGQACILFEQSGGRIELGQGKIKKFLKTVVPSLNEETPPTEIWELIEEIPLRALVSSWPYEEVSGNLVFKGIQVEE